LIYAGAVNASLFEDYFQLMKRHFGDSFEYESTVDFFAKTGSVMVLSKGVGAGHLLSADSRETFRESQYFPSKPNLSDQVERGADMALVNLSNMPIWKTKRSIALLRHKQTKAWSSNTR